MKIFPYQIIQWWVMMIVTGRGQAVENPKMKISQNQSIQWVTMIARTGR
jgi:hypothetical protein